MRHYASDPDAHLLQKMQTGQVDATTWRDFIQRIRRWIGSNFPSLYAQADDLAGEAALCVFESLPSFRGEARFIRWVHRIVYHVVCKQLRKQAEMIILSFEDTREEAAVRDEISQRLLYLAAEAALQTLTEQERIVFLSRVTKEMNHKEIARRLGISDNASRQTWMRASEKIGRYRRENL